jgi:hypothetical protein
MNRSACLKGANNGSAILARAKEKAARERLLNSNLMLAGPLQKPAVKSLASSPPLIRLKNSLVFQ